MSTLAKLRGGSSSLRALPTRSTSAPFVDEEEALGWGFDHLADFEPEDWEPYELSLKAPRSAP